MNEQEFIKLSLKNNQNLTKLGDGSFGAVYKIVYQGKEYAAKKISKAKIDYNEDVELRGYMKNALQREIQILQKMSEFENSVKFYYFFEDDKDYILVLELCHSDLKKLLKEKGRFTSLEILAIMEGINKPLRYMHNNGFIHRDIKPENIMIKYVDNFKTKFIPKLADYGISRQLDHGIATTSVGTPRYMAPEILLGNSDYIDKSDLFSIGVMMYEFYFNSYPFSMPFSNNKNEVMKIYAKKKKDCEDKNLDDLLNKLLIFDVNRRISWEEYFNHPFFNRNKGVMYLNNQLGNLSIYNKNRYQMINVYDYILEKMIYQNYIGKESFKNNNPTKFITVDECLKYKDSPFFILGILAKYLQKIGIFVLIEREELQRDLDLKDYHKNLFQFICNGYILKCKYLLDFDLGVNRIQNLIQNPIERSIFNEKLKNVIMKIYNLREDEILVTNIKRDQNKYTAALVIKPNFNISLTRNELIKEFEKIDYELKTLTRLDKELIAPVITLNTSMLFPREDNKNNKWSIGEKRGGEDYIPPLGWIKYAIRIDHCFNDKNFDWISQLHKPVEWCVAYCGITGITKNIIQLFENDNDIRHPGKKVGIGVYCPSDPKIMEECTETIDANGENYKVGFMLRIKPDKIRASQRNKNIYIVNGNDDELRPYGILIKRIFK